MFFPWGTNAPVYHFPFGTIGLIVVNVIVFILCMVSWASGFSGGWSDVNGECPTTLIDWLYLDYSTINPIQWLTSAFAHAGPEHLCGNMLFLWVFGLVVEGKVGWKKFLLIYLTIAVTQCGFEQLLMRLLSFGYPELSNGGSLGASSAIFGLMAICIIWAPRNDIHVIAVFPFSYYFVLYRAFRFDIGIIYVGAIYLILNSLEIYFGIINGGIMGAMGSSFLHMMGFVPGAMIGLALLVTRRVDCEGYDIISIYTGKEGEAVLTLEQEQELKETREREARTINDALTMGRQQVAQYLAAGNVDMALNRFRLLRKCYPGVEWNRKQLGKVIDLLHCDGRWLDSIGPMETYVNMFPAQSDRVRLKLAQIQLVEARRPDRSLKVLDGLPDKLAPELLRRANLLRRRVKVAIRKQTTSIDLGDETEAV